MKDWSGMWFFSMQKRCIKETYLVQDFSIVHRILKTLKDRLKSGFMLNALDYYLKVKNDTCNCMTVDIKLNEMLYNSIFST